MQSPIEFQVIVLVGVIIHVLSLIAPNYLRFQAAKTNPKPPSSLVTVQPEEALIPAEKIERVRMKFLLCFWMIAVIVVLEILNVYSILPVAFFMLPSQTLPVWITWVALFLLIIATTMSFFAGLALRKDFLFPDEAVRADWSLCTTGIYSKIRHPFYSAMNLSVVAIPLLLAFWPLLILAPFIILTQYKIARAEEALMAKHFGEKFKAYKHATRMFL